MAHFPGFNPRRSGHLKHRSVVIAAALGLSNRKALELVTNQSDRKADEPAHDNRPAATGVDRPESAPSSWRHV